MMYEPGDLQALTTELQWQRVIQAAAAWLGYITYHTYFSKRSEKGFPDLVCAGRGRVVYIECKKPKGKLSEDQAVWLQTLRSVGQLAMVARPRDWELVYHALADDVVVLPEYRERVNKVYGDMVLPEVVWRRRV